MDMTAPAALTPRKARIREAADQLAPSRRAWREKNAFFHEEDLRYLRFLIPEGGRVLEIGCGAGDLLAALKPSRGVGVDISGKMVALAREAYPDLEFVEGDAEDAATLDGIEGPFDAILVVDTIGQMDDVQAFLAKLHRLCDRDTRIIIGYFSHLWQPVLKVARPPASRTARPTSTCSRSPT